MAGWRLVLVGTLVLGLLGCDDDLPAPGTEGGRCIVGRGCDPGLTCVSGWCVRLMDARVVDRGPLPDWPPLPDAGPRLDSVGPDRGAGAEAGARDSGWGDGFVWVPDAWVGPDGVLPGGCGDGKRDPGEACDGPDLGGQTCASLGSDFGPLRCKADCTLDTAGCAKHAVVTVSAGTFSMGSPPLEACRDAASETSHPVVLTRAFRMPVVPVTQAQFKAVFSHNPAKAQSCGGDCPVENVSWHEAAAYCNALSKQAGQTACYACVGAGQGVVCETATAYAGAKVLGCPGFRLPTEAEWEYAYRANNNYTAYYNGQNDSTVCKSCSPKDKNADDIAWYCGNAKAVAQPVGHKAKNAFGLHDMAGNVMEWMHDGWKQSLGSAMVTDPVVPVKGATYRVRRGGSPDRMPHGLRAAHRDPQAPALRDALTGFRCVQTVPSTKPDAGMSPDSAAAKPDAGMPPDSAVTLDAAPVADRGVIDAAPVPDAALPDQKVSTPDRTVFTDSMSPDRSLPDRSLPDRSLPDQALLSVCGDGLVTGNEVCDGSKLGGVTCAGLGHLGGTLACNSTCTGYDTSKCNKITWVNVKAGKFTMGSPTTEPCRELDGSMETAHTVTLTRGFVMPSVEVTRTQFKALLGYDPSTNASCSSNCPVDTVSWHEAAAFCNALSSKESRSACYTCSGSGPGVTCALASSLSSVLACTGYRLPTEAEWEYAYRAGTTTAYYNGAASSSACTSCSTVDPNAALIGWSCQNAGYTNTIYTQSVAGKTANAWGLYDLPGNVAEWCHDRWQQNLGASAVTDPTGPASGNYRVARGHAFTLSARGLRAAARLYYVPTHKTSYTGFRCVRTVTP